VKHASLDALKHLESLLLELRKFPDLRERSLGIFYRKSKPFLHFHEDPAGLFADLRISEEFERFPVNSASERGTLIKTIERALATVPPSASER
jgi:hypothetical protein